GVVERRQLAFGAAIDARHVQLDRVGDVTARVGHAEFVVIREPAESSQSVRHLLDWAAASKLDAELVDAALILRLKFDEVAEPAPVEAVWIVRPACREVAPLPTRGRHDADVFLLTTATRAQVRDGAAVGR